NSSLASSAISRASARALTVSIVAPPSTGGFLPRRQGRVPQEPPSPPAPTVAGRRAAVPPAEGPRRPPGAILTRLASGGCPGYPRPGGRRNGVGPRGLPPRREGARRPGRVWVAAPGGMRG